MIPKLKMLCSAAALALGICLPGVGQAANYDGLEMYFDESMLVETATRSPQPISRVAENMTVVTAAEIERMNAHTLAEVLDRVTGVEMWILGGPGTGAQASILGSANNHVTIMMDGVALNPVNSGIPDIGYIPVQQIKKIEIVKGPASSAWGSALGGVINIITKNGRLIDKGESVYAAAGSANLIDLRAEARGREDKIGYYLTAGRLQAGALTPSMKLASNSLYAKLDYDFTESTHAFLAINYNWVRKGAGEYRDPSDSSYDYTQANLQEKAYAVVGLTSEMRKDMTLDLSARVSKQPFTVYQYSAWPYVMKDYDDRIGESARVTWKTASQTVVVGIDNDRTLNKDEYLADGRTIVARWGAYLNDTIGLGNLTATPGIRFDHTNKNGNVTSPSLGLTYAVRPNTIVRLFAARGFNTPTPGDSMGTPGWWSPNPNLKVETVTSYQVGIETADLKVLWAKATLFRDDIRDGLDYSTDMTLNIGRMRHEGIELQAKTIPVYGVTFQAGAEFIRTRDLNAEQNLHFYPTQVYDLGVAYSDAPWHALLHARHINWDAWDWAQSKYKSALLDLTITRKIWHKNGRELIVYATGHNLLNTDQYAMIDYPNPGRWYEAGVKYEF